MTWPTTRDVFTSSMLVVQSDLQAAFVQQDGKTVAWVTTTQGESKPVAGAVVQVYLSTYNQVRCTCRSADATSWPAGTTFSLLCS